MADLTTSPWLTGKPAPAEQPKASRWTPGMPSPNPSGRPRGIVDRRSRITQALMGDAEAIVQIVKEAAAAGDLQACGLILSRVAPALKPESDRVQFKFDAKSPFAEQIEQVLQAVADGELAVDTANQIIAAINVLAGVRNVEAFADEMRRAGKSKATIAGGVKTT